MYSPKIDEELIPVLYHVAQARRMPMTRLVTELIGQALATEDRTLIFYESPGRVLALLQDIIKIMGDRRGALAREMTKLHEEFLRGRLSEIVQNLQERTGIKGECTLLVAGNLEKEKISPFLQMIFDIDSLEEEEKKLLH